MAQSRLNIRNCKAWEDRQGPGGPTLHVTCEVETSNSNQTPQLKEAVPQGINPAILILDLSITSTGIGNPVMGWKQAKFEKKVSAGQYTSVDIHSNGQSVCTCKVEIVQ
jgi:hypothetical protein